MTKSHLAHLLDVLTLPPGAAILDIGSSTGIFLVDAAQKGFKATGIEYRGERVAEAQERAGAAGVTIEVVQGKAEQLPFKDSQFDFANLSEVIEHVQNPEEVLKEVFRVLKPGGKAYVSVPSRFSIYDTHFHVPFVNWLPRPLSDSYLTLWGKHKQYARHENNDFQQLSEMHYHTFSGSERLFAAAGFSSRDLRLQKLQGSTLKRIAYYLVRPWYVRAFHFLIEKPA